MLLASRKLRAHGVATPGGATATVSNMTAPTTTATATATTSSTAALPVEAKGQDLQHAVDLYQKGIEITHSAATYDDYCRAIEHFSLAIAVRNSQARFFLARGNAFRAINEFEPAVRDYTAALALDDRSPVYYANRGACYRKLNEPAAALEDLTIAIEMDVKKGPHYFSRALVLYDAGYYREAVLDFTKALDDSSSVGTRIEYRALQTRGVCYRKLGHLSKCIDDLERAIAIDARNPTGFGALAQAHYEHGDVDAAIVQYTRALALSPTSATLFSQRGLCYYRKGESAARACLADFTASIQLDGKDPQAYFYRGSMRLWLALELLDANAAAQVTTMAPVALTPAASTLASGQPLTITDSTSSSTVSLLVAKPANTDAGVAAAIVSQSSQDMALEANGGLSMSALGFLTADEQLAAAFADIEMAATLCPNSAQYQLGMAMIAQLRHDYSAASTLFDAVSRSDSANVVVMYHAALTAQMLDDRERALLLLTDAVDALPHEPLLFEARGLLLQELQLHALAISDFTRALALAPERAAPILYLRCESALRLAQFTDAVADATHALARGYTHDVSVYNARGMAYRGLGDYESAVCDLSVCLAAAPNNHIFQFHRGLCYMESRRYADAIPDLLAAATAHPRDTTVLYYIGLCYYHERTTSESRKYLQLALHYGAPPDILPDVYYHMGLAYALESHNMDAIENFTSALEHSSRLAAQLAVDGASDSSAATSSMQRRPSPTELRASQLQYVHERAKALQLEQYYDEAIEDFSDVIAHNPNNAHAHFRRGFAYKALGQLEDAAADLETAKLLDPTNVDLVVNYRELKDTNCVVLCRPGDEKVY